MASFHIDDVKDSYLPSEKKVALKDAGEKHVHVTMAFISDDTRHNQAFVQHVNALALKYVAEAIMKHPPIRTYCRSDGAPTQYANATMFYWMGQQHYNTNTRMDWSIHCSCHGITYNNDLFIYAYVCILVIINHISRIICCEPGKDKCDPEMGWLKNIIRSWMLREKLDTMAEVRLQNYKDVALKLIELDAGDPGHGDLIPGGIYRREILTIPAYGAGSAYQEIPREAGVPGATKDRQFTDQCSALEKVGGVDKAVILMRHRSCHFCDCCMRLDPMDRANRKTKAAEGDNKGPNPCAYEVMCGPADNIVHVPRKREKKKILKKVWTSGDSAQTLFGKRGEPIEPNQQFFTVRKLDSGYGDSGFMYMEVEGEEGLLVVPAVNLIASQVQIVLPQMRRQQKEDVLGEKEYGNMERNACAVLFRSLYLYLPQRERERIWGACPQ